MTWICDEVKQLDLLLNEYLGTTKLIKDVKTKKISQPGENYGSIMYSLDVTVEDKQNKHEETIHTVAKVLPQGELIRQIFNIQTTYKNEMAFYKVIVPTMLYFQKELDIQKPIDCFAKCYAVRKNLLENSDVIDDDAVLLLENLKTEGFINIDKVKGFDLETAEMVLRSLAQFHGISLALKIKKPEVFEKKIKMHCDDYYIAVGEMPLMVPTIQLLLNENEEIKEQILPKVVGWEGAKRIPKESIFNTLVHDDLWTNNTMQKFKNGKPVENKLVDFQIIAYGSPARDLFFFLWSSLPLALIKTHLDYLIKYYYDNLITVLGNHKIDITPFTFEYFLKEIHDISPFEFKHAFYFHLVAVHAKKGGFEMTKLPTVEDIYNGITDVAKEKAFYMTKECYKRGWFRSI